MKMNISRVETPVFIFLHFQVKYSRLEVRNASMLLNNIMYGSIWENLLYAVGIRSVAIVVRQHYGFKCSKMSRRKCMMFYVNVFIPPMLRESLLCFCTNVLRTRIATYAYPYSVRINAGCKRWEA
jgi:hypothetical protein